MPAIKRKSKKLLSVLSDVLNRASLCYGGKITYGFTGDVIVFRWRGVFNDQYCGCDVAFTEEEIKRVMGKPDVMDYCMLRFKDAFGR